MFKQNPSLIYIFNKLKHNCTISLSSHDINQLNKSTFSLFKKCFQIFLCILCPLLTIFIRYTTKITISKDCKGKVDKRKEDEDEIEITDEEEDEDEDNNNIKKQHRPTIITFKKSEKVGLLAAIFYLYSAPITIFICNIVSVDNYFCHQSCFI